MTYFEYRERQRNPRDRKVKELPCSYELVDFTMEQACSIEEEVSPVVVENTLKEYFGE